jgi:amino acid transporter
VLGSIGGFTTGWFLALGSLFASGLYAIGFAEYAISLTGAQYPPYVSRAVAIGITMLIAFLNVKFSGNSRFNLQGWIVWGNVGILFLLIAVSFFGLSPEMARPTFPAGFHGTIAAVSLIYISFFGYQLIANNADEIIDPEKTIPRAMVLSMIISMAIYVLVAVAAVMSVPWEELAESSAPLVLVANKSFGGKGWIVISIGGVLASLGALSSTLISQSRQTYAMGKDRFFPDYLGKLNEKTKQPKSALLVGAGLISLILLLSDLEFIAKAANFSLLVSLLPVSLAMRRIYQKNPASKPKARWKHHLPAITLVINLSLLLTLDIVSLAFGQQLALAGFAVYFFYSRKREKTGREGLTIVLEEERRRFSVFTRNRILIPMANPETQKALLLFSRALLSKMGGEIVVSAIKNVPQETDFYDALAEAGETLAVIKRSVELARSENIRIKPVLRASYDVARGIIDVGEEEKCDLIVMGFPKPQEDGKPGILSKLLKSSSTDVAVLNLKVKTDLIKIDKIGVYLDNARHLNIMLMCATAVAEKRGARIIIFGFLPPDYTKKQKVKLDKIILAALMTLKSTALYEVRLEISENHEEDLVQMSSEFDALIMGLRQTKNLEASLPFRVSRQAACSVLLVKTISRFRKLAKKI